ncbi:MAG: response regulator [Anaerolineales bacterium]
MVGLIKVLIADDHRLFRQGLQHVFEGCKEIEIVGEAENGRQAVNLARRLKPDIVLMDINMPVLDGVQATHLIREVSPTSQVIILTMYRQDQYVFEAIKAGARGYLLKDIDEHQLIEAIFAVQRGEALVDPSVAARLLDEFRRLSFQADSHSSIIEELNDGEMKVLRLVAQGADNKTVAERLNLSEHTVANRLSEIYRKLHVNSRTQAALVALRKGWAKLEEETGDNKA